MHCKNCGKSFASAAITAAVGIFVSWMAFGTQPYAAFFQYLPHTMQAVLSEGGTGWDKIQSLYGVMRWLGASDAVGWIAQGVLTVLCASAMVLLWRRDVPFALKAAALAASAMLATPYLYMHDFPVLTVSVAFLAADRAFDRTEWMCVMAVIALYVAYPLLGAPVGLLMIAVVLSLSLRRLWQAAPAAIALQRG